MARSVPCRRSTKGETTARRKLAHPWMLKGLLEELVKRPPRRVWQRPPDILAQDTFLNELVKTRVCESMRRASHLRIVFTHLRTSIIAPKDGLVTRHYNHYKGKLKGSTISSALAYD